MKLPNIFQKLKERLIKRWIDEDFPGGTPRFQLSLLARDISVFFLIPISAVIFFKIVESSLHGPSKPREKRRTELKSNAYEKHSQIIQFQPSAGGEKEGSMSFSKRAPGTLVRVKLLNVVETYSNAPVHAQILDSSLGREFVGATVIGDASIEGSSGRITINFKFVRHPNRLGVAAAISARALSLDGTFGIAAQKKEGFFARAAIRSASGNSNSIDTSSDSGDFKTMVARALASGLMQEFKSEASIANNRAQVFSLKPMTEFFVELTDFFPGQN